MDWQDKKEQSMKTRIGVGITPGRLCSQTRIGNVSGYRCVSDCRSRGREFDPDPVPYFRGD